MAQRLPNRRRLPVERLSRTRTAWPEPASRSAMSTRPINPQPPVTSHFIRALVLYPYSSCTRLAQFLLPLGWERRRMHKSGLGEPKGKRNFFRSWSRLILRYRSSRAIIRRRHAPHGSRLVNQLFAWKRRGAMLRRCVQEALIMSAERLEERQSMGTSQTASFCPKTKKAKHSRNAPDANAHQRQRRRRKQRR